MKLSNFQFALLLVLVMAVLLGTTDARKKNKKANRKFKAGVCKYDRKGEEGVCNTSTNTKDITLLLKKGDPATCQPSKAVSKPCSDNSLTKKKKIKGCKYERKGSDWTECDPATNERVKVMKLKEGSNPQCPTVRTKTKSCKKGSRRSRPDAKITGGTR